MGAKPKSTRASGPETRKPVKKAVTPEQDKKRAAEEEEARRKDLEEQLDEGLKGTFPASDPVSVTTRLKPGKINARK